MYLGNAGFSSPFPQGGCGNSWHYLCVSGWYVVNTHVSLFWGQNSGNYSTKLFQLVIKNLEALGL